MQIGSVVRLKSGGPKMTIISQAHDARWVCLYFHDGKFIDISVPAQALQAAND